MRFAHFGNSRQRIALAAVFALLLGGLLTLGNPVAVAADTAIDIKDFAFTPRNLTIPIGTVVTWTNRDTAPHTASSDADGWNSGILSTGESYSFTFQQAGMFPYHCNVHPSMHAMIVVTAGAAPPPTTGLSTGGTGAFASDAFQQLWAKTDANPNGRTYIWGPAPFTAGVMEAYTEAPGGTRLVQYFDKGRMELSPNGTVTAGLLTTELMTGRQQNGDTVFQQRSPARVTVAGDTDNPFPTYADLAKVQAGEQSAPSAQIAKLYNADGSFGVYAPAMNDALARTTAYDAATRHNIPKAFADFRDSPSYGGLPAIGLAVTEPVWANVKVAGKTVPVLMQGFERRVFTYTPDNPTAFRVEYGNIGRAYYTWRTAGGA